LEQPKTYFAFHIEGKDFSFLEQFKNVEIDFICNDKLEQIKCYQSAIDISINTENIFKALSILYQTKPKLAVYMPIDNRLRRIDLFALLIELLKHQNQTLFHLEDEQLTFFGKLQRAHINYQFELSNKIINYGQSAIDISVNDQDLLTFLHIIRAKNPQLKTYTYANGEFQILNLEATIYELLLKEKENSTFQIEKRTIKYLDAAGKEYFCFFIPYYNEYFIYYRLDRPYAKVIKKGSNFSYFVNTLHPKFDYEKDVINTINEYFMTTEQKRNRTII